MLPDIKDFLDYEPEPSTEVSYARVPPHVKSILQDNPARFRWVCRTCRAPMQLVQVIHGPTGATVHCFYRCPNACPVYEVARLTHDGRPVEYQIIECRADEDALEQANGWARYWHTRVALYRVPAINTSSSSSFDLWPDMKLIAEIPAPSGPQ